MYTHVEKKMLLPALHRERNLREGRGGGGGVEAHDYRIRRAVAT